MANLIPVLFAITLNGSTTRCEFSQLEIQNAVNGIASALERIELNLVDCANDYQSFGLYSAICFAWSAHKDKRLSCASNLMMYEGDDSFQKLGYAVMLHREQYCGSSIAIVELLSDLGIDDFLLKLEILNAAVRYGDYKAALKLADEYKRAGGEYLASAAQVLYHLGRSRYGDRLKNSLAIATKSLPSPKQEDRQFEWIESIVENKTNACQFGRFYTQLPLPQPLTTLPPST